MSFNWLVIRFNAGAGAPLPETWGNRVAAFGRGLPKVIHDYSIHLARCDRAHPHRYAGDANCVARRVSTLYQVYAGQTKGVRDVRRQCKGNQA
jgi:hypothetical protein